MNVVSNLFVSLAVCAFSGCNQQEFNGSGSKRASNDVEADKVVVEVPDDASVKKRPPEKKQGKKKATKKADTESAADQTEPPRGAEALIDPEVRSVSFGLLLNDISCGLCHVRIEGDVVSTTSVNPPAVSAAADLKVAGTWWVHGTMGLPAGKVAASGGIRENHTGPEMPRDLDGDGSPDFPRFSTSGFDELTGTLEHGSTELAPGRVGDLVLIGTPEEPIHLDGEVFVDGDLVIKGWYEGIGTIYVTGNVYIPGNLQAKDTPFPYGTGDKATQARAAIDARMSALALAAKGAIVAGDFEKRWGPHHLLGDGKPTSVDAAGIRRLAEWFDGGYEGYRTLFDQGQVCGRSTNGSVSQIDGFLYSEKAMMLRADDGVPVTLNGGLMAQSLVLMHHAERCSTSPQGLEIRYDWRLKEGLNLLGLMSEFFNEAKR